MSRDLNDLKPELKAQVNNLLSLCNSSGYPMRQFYTLCTPFEQGKLWRQSRLKEQIEQKIDELRNNNAEFLADCIDTVAQQKGRHITMTIPGFSWHRWERRKIIFGW